MNHSFLISKGIYPKKFVSIDESNLENELEATHPSYARLTPLFSVHEFLKKLHPKHSQRKLVEKYLKEHFLSEKSGRSANISASLPSGSSSSENASTEGSGMTPSAETAAVQNSQKETKKTKKNHSSFVAEEFFKYEIPYFKESMEDYLLTFQQLYVLFFRMSEREFTPELQEIREYLINRQYMENVMQNQGMKPMENTVLTIITTENYVERIEGFLKSRLQILSTKKASSGGEEPGEDLSFLQEIVSIETSEHAVNVSFKRSAGQDSFKKFVTTLISPFSWRRNIHTILILSHTGRHYYRYLHNVLETAEKVRVQAHPRWLQDEICRDLEVTFTSDSRGELLDTVSFNPTVVAELCPQSFDTMIHAYLTSSGEIMIGSTSREWWDFVPKALDIGQAILPTEDGNGIGICSKAYFKLDEIMETDMRLTPLLQKKGQVGIDIGASPGGWSQVMTKFCSKIYSVDPGLLDDFHTFYKDQVVHIRKKAENFILEDLQSEFEKHNGPFIDFLVCDMNANPKVVAEILSPFAPYMRPGAHIVMTLKLIKHVNSVLASKKFEEAVKIFESQFTDFTCHWLFANTANERMLVATRK